MYWDAGLLDKATAALNVYNAFTAYLGSGGGAAWVRRNTKSYELVTSVKQLRGYL